MNDLANRLSPIAAFLARHSHLIALALFVAVGLAVLDDYGISHDEEAQRRVGYAAFNYIMGNADELTGYFYEHDRYYGIAVEAYYGVAFEVPLVVAERLLGLEDSRAIYLSRHLLTHLLFLAAGFFAWLLAHRLFGSRIIALFAMLIFLLHPRLYAHSFFNTKDLPFLSMFMVALYLAHRAFRRDSAWAFALCGAGVGLLMNIRVMGVMLLAAVLGMLALDGFRAMSRGGGGDWGVKRALANSAAFLAAFAAVLYAARPLLWENPLNFINELRVLSAHPNVAASLFRGELVWSRDLPWDYIPVWMLITAPPVALALAALGIAAAARLCAADWRGAFANSAARFGLLSAACLILPVAAAIALNSTMYNGWRHMYFLWAPACVLGAFGMNWLAALPKPPLRAAAFALAALGIALAAVQTVRLHPYQHEYFNPLADKSRLAERWEMDYWKMAHREGLQALLKMRTDERIIVRALRRTAYLIPENDRARVTFNYIFPDFRIRTRGAHEKNAIYKREVYGVPLVSVFDARAESEAAFKALYDAARALPPVANAGGFDIHRDGATLLYAKENCGAEDRRGTFHLATIASQRLDSPPGALRKEWENGDFWSYGGTFGGKCLITIPLPEYPIHSVEIEQRLDDGETLAWRAEIIFADSLDDYAEALSALPPSGPDASAGGFDIYRNGGTLIYIKRQCADDDARGRFYLSIFPADPADLPQSEREAGRERHQALNFGFHRYGAALDGDCVIIRDLPDYPIDRIETGQWIPGESGAWRAEFALPEFYERRLRRAESSGEPAIRSDFDVHLADNSLAYIRKDCADDDARGRFWLSVFPEDLADLPQDRRGAGLEHESLNFDFADYGAIVGGDCVIVRELPDYPIDRIETGQFIPGEGELWRGRIAVGE